MPIAITVNLEVFVRTVYKSRIDLFDLCCGAIRQKRQNLCFTQSAENEIFIQNGSVILCQNSRVGWMASVIETNLLIFICLMILMRYLCNIAIDQFRYVNIQTWHRGLRK